MAWEPDRFTPQERKAAASTVIQAHRIVDRLIIAAVGDSRDALLRVDEMLTMLHQDIYVSSELRKDISPSDVTQLPPSMS